MQNLPFVDIESVPQFQFMPIDGPDAEFFRKRFDFEYNAGQKQWANIYDERAGLMAEYGKVVSISMGVMIGNKFYVKTFIDEDEKIVLTKFAETLRAGIRGANSISEIKTLVGHNIKEFDGPYLMRRMIINGIELPPVLNLMGKKSWDIPFIDTMELWGAGQWKYMISQDQLCHLLGIESSKKKIQGKDIRDLYYVNYAPDSSLPWEKEDAFKAIAEYNAADVVSNARIYAKLKGYEVFRDDQIVFVKPT